MRACAHWKLPIPPAGNHLLPVHYPLLFSAYRNHIESKEIKFFAVDYAIHQIRHSVENTACHGQSSAKDMSWISHFAGRTFIIRSRISSPFLTFTYRDFKLRLLSRLRISHNTQRPCYETITVFDFCGTNCFGEESNLTKIWMNNPNRAEYAVDTEVSWSLSRSLVVTYTTTKQRPSYVCKDCAGYFSRITRRNVLCWVLLHRNRTGLTKPFATR